MTKENDCRTCKQNKRERKERPQKEEKKCFKKKQTRKNSLQADNWSSNIKNEINTKMQRKKVGTRSKNLILLIKKSIHISKVRNYTKGH